MDYVSLEKQINAVKRKVILKLYKENSNVADSYLKELQPTQVNPNSSKRKKS